ncbi:MAG: DUF5662 family protein [Clostridiales bacterium]|nr:DUF5662 family protein [Clostridiales bacterium]
MINCNLFSKNLFGHFTTITHHKLLVMQHCFRVGLYKQGLLHDLSKYSPIEFIPGVKYFQGNLSPNNKQRIVEGRSDAWLHHKGRNKHHFEYWIDYPMSSQGVTGLVGIEMPVNYVAEMFCDRVAASKVYAKDAYTDRYPLEYYERGPAKNIMHPNTAKLLHKLLVMLAEKGEDETFRYIKYQLLKKKRPH